MSRRDILVSESGRHHFLPVSEDCRINPLPVCNAIANPLSKHRPAALSFLVLCLFSPGFRQLFWVLPDNRRVSSPFLLDFHSPNPADYPSVRLESSPCSGTPNPK